MGGFCQHHRVQPYWCQHVHVCLLTSPAATAGAPLGWYNLLGTRKRRKSGPRVSVLQWKVYGTGNIRRFAYYTYTHERRTRQDTAGCPSLENWGWWVKEIFDDRPTLPTHPVPQTLMHNDYTVRIDC